MAYYSKRSRLLLGWRSFTDRQWVSPRKDTDRFAHDVIAVTNQSAFRVRNDDGDLSTATWVANENTNASLQVDTNYRIRIEFEETAGASPSSTQQCRLQYNKNDTGWQTVTDVSSNVRSSASPNVADGAATGNVLTTSTRAFVAGQFEEVDGLTGSGTGLSNSQCEHEHCFQIRSVDVVNGDSIQLRLVLGSAGVPMSTYTQTPTITVIEAAPPLANPELLGRPYGAFGAREMQQILVR